MKIKFISKSIIIKLCNKHFFIAFLIFIIALTFRIFLFETIYQNERHSFAGYYGSAAIGLYNSEGLTFNTIEVNRIDSTKNINDLQNFNTFKTPGERKKWLYGLAGPVYTLTILWKLTHVLNFTPYILLQILLDSVIIVFFYFVTKKYYRNFVLYIVLIFLIFNPISIAKTLSVSYDFWAPFSVLIGFCGLLYAFSKEKNYHILFLTGIFTGITLWFRDIVNFLPFFFAIAIAIFYRWEKKESYKNMIKKVSLYLLPVIISISFLGLQRYQNTGSFRPTQTFFWHAFFCAIGQFDNPYGLKNKDMEIWNFGHKLNNEISITKQFEYSEDPANLYEETLKKEGIKFIKNNPLLFIRNMVYRTGIMIAPTFFTISSSSLSDSFDNTLSKVIGVLLIFLWIFGLYFLIRSNNVSLYIIIPVYLYFFGIFSWYYLVGRVILCFAFINIILYSYGIFQLYILLLSKKNINRKNN